jgi:amidase
VPALLDTCITVVRMTLVSAFDDDALGDLDAVGVVEAYRSGTVSRTEVIEAAIARTEKATLN